jgi:hypothetical protein
MSIYRYNAERFPEPHRRCQLASMLTDIFETSILTRITDQTTPEQFRAAQHSLLLLYQRLEGQKGWAHYSSPQGRHTCVREAYTEAVYKLKNLAIMQPEIVPPAAKQQVITVEGVVIDLEEEYRTSREETDLGTEDTPPDGRDTR